MKQATTPTNTKSRVGRRPIHSQAEILQAACRLFAAKGYYDTTMQDIADAAGMTKGGVYHYLDSKEDVLYLLHDHFIKEGLRRLEPLLHSCRPPREKLQDVIAMHLRLMHDYYQEIRLFFREMHVLTGDKYATVRDLRHQYERGFVQAIEECISAGVLDTHEPVITGRFIMGAVSWMFTWYRPGGRLGPDEMAEILTHMVLDGLDRQRLPLSEGG